MATTVIAQRTYQTQVGEPHGVLSSMKGWLAAAPLGEPKKPNGAASRASQEGDPVDVASEVAAGDGLRLPRGVRSALRWGSNVLLGLLRPLGDSPVWA